jgi:hypothetical protein
MELATWRPRNQPLIAFKDAKGVKDCAPPSVQTLLNFCELSARDRYIPNIQENCASSEKCEIPRNMRYRESRMQPDRNPPVYQFLLLWSSAAWGRLRPLESAVEAPFFTDVDRDRPVRAMTAGQPTAGTALFPRLNSLVPLVSIVSIVSTPQR